MPRPFREILVLREIEELSYRQISDITGHGHVAFGARTTGIWACLAPRGRWWCLNWHRNSLLTHKIDYSS
jgi:hypothetical protein